MPIHQVFPQQYQAQLDQKVDKIKTAFDHFNLPEIEVFASPSSHYRLRAEFKIWHEDGRAHYAMFEPGERKRPFIIDSFPVASHQINELMRLLLTAINDQPILRQRLFQMEFLTILLRAALVSLIYHKKLDDD